jgi:hypothetical protein
MEVTQIGVLDIPQLVEAVVLDKVQLKEIQVVLVEVT